MSDPKSSPSSATKSVLHVTPYYPPDRIGGVGEVARTIHEELVQRGFDSQVLSSGSTQDDPLVHRVGATPHWFAALSWRRIRLARKFDVLHVHQGEALLLLLALRLVRDRPLALVMFHVDVRRREEASRGHVIDGRRFGPTGLTALNQRIYGFVKAFFDRLAWVLADGVVVETECLKRELSDLRPRRAVDVVPYGVSSRASGSPPDEVELLYVGTAGNRKRTHLLAEVVERVRRVYPRARMRVVGFWRDADPQLSDEITRLGMDDAFEFVGPLASADVVPYYRAARVLVLPSAYEGLPMVLLEAMLEGLVPVATDVSGHPDVIEDGVNGFLVPVDSAASMAEKCAVVLGDEDGSRYMGELAKRVVQKGFSTSEQATRVVYLYDKLLSRHG